MSVCLGSIVSAHPSQAQGLLRFAEELAASSIGRSAAAEVAGNGVVARRVLTELGVVATSDVEAVSKFAALTSQQQAFALVHSDTMANIFRSKFPGNPSNDWDVVTALNTLRFTAGSNVLSQAATKPTTSFLSVDITAGEGKLRAPIVFCKTSLCEIKAETRLNSLTSQQQLLEGVRYPGVPRSGWESRRLADELLEPEGEAGGTHARSLTNEFDMDKVQRRPALVLFREFGPFEGERCWGEFRAWADRAGSSRAHAGGGQATGPRACAGDRGRRDRGSWASTRDVGNAAP